MSTGDRDDETMSITPSKMSTKRVEDAITLSAHGITSVGKYVLNTKYKCK